MSETTIKELLEAGVHFGHQQVFGIKNEALYMETETIFILSIFKKLYNAQ